MLSFIARGCYAIILTTISITAALFVLSHILSGQPALWLKILSLISLLFTVFTFYFFRDPDRKTEINPKALIAPADGTVIDIRNIKEDQYLKDGSIRISIFMSIFNVHVNRSPVSGTVELIKYNPGKFVSAFKDKASEDNENLFVGIKSSINQKKIAVKFIAGLIARRIVFYKKLNDSVKQAERINMIRFGSRVDLYCPLGSVVKVKKGDSVKAGETVMAVF